MNVPGLLLCITESYVNRFIHEHEFNCLFQFELFNHGWLIFFL